MLSLSRKERDYSANNELLDCVYYNLNFTKRVPSKNNPEPPYALSFLLFIHPSSPTSQMTQQNANKLIATATLRNIITSTKHPNQQTDRRERQTTHRPAPAS